MTECGEVATWGRGQAGCLGQGDETSSVVPRVVTSLQGIRIRNVAAGWNHSAFVTGLIASHPILFTSALRLFLSHNVTLNVLDYPSLFFSLLSTMMVGGLNKDVLLNKSFFSFFLADYPSFYILVTSVGVTE